MTQTFDKEKAVACRTQLKIRVSAAVDRLILAKIGCRGLQGRTAGTDATVEPGFAFYTRNPCELSTQFDTIGAGSSLFDQWNAAQIHLHKSFPMLKRKGKRKGFVGNE